MSSSSYVPNEPPDVIIEEVTWLQGAFISSLLCGVQITLSVLSFLAVLKQRIPRGPRIALLVYIFLLCAIMTAGQQINLLFIQMGFIEQRNYPGGPSAFLSSQYTKPVSVASVFLFVIGNWMMESLLVWRCKVVCIAGEQPMWCAVAFPFVLLISEYVIGILFLRKFMQGGYMTHYAIAYLGLSLSLSISVTAIITARLLLHRRRMVRQFGRVYGAYYAGVAAVLIESASFYTAFLILVIIFFSIGTSTSNVLQQAVVHIESVTSMLIIYRITQGDGWNDDMGVSSTDWRGSTDVERFHEEVHLEKVPDPAQTTLSVSPTGTKSTSSINATLVLDDVV